MCISNALLRISSTVETSAWAWSAPRLQTSQAAKRKDKTKRRPLRRTSKEGRPRRKATKTSSVCLAVRRRCRCLLTACSSRSPRPSWWSCFISPLWGNPGASNNRGGVSPVGHVSRLIHDWLMPFPHSCPHQLVSSPPSEESQPYKRGDRGRRDAESLLQPLPFDGAPPEQLHHREELGGATTEVLIILSTPYLVYFYLFLTENYIHSIIWRCGIWHLQPWSP